MEKQICRLCLCRCEARLMKSIFDTDSKHSDLNYLEFILKFACVKIEKDDDFTKKLCPECIYQIMRMFTFKELCEHSDLTLRTYSTSNSHLLKCLGQTKAAALIKGYTKTENEQAVIPNEIVNGVDVNHFEFEKCVVKSEIKSEAQEMLIYDDHCYYEKYQGDVEDDDDNIIFEIKNGDDCNETTSSHSTNIIYPTSSAKTKSQLPRSAKPKQRVRKRKDRTLDGKEGVKCSKCSATFKNSMSLHFHLRVHAEKNFACQEEKCGLTFPTAEKLDHHNKLIHLSKHPDGYKCYDCNKIYAKRGSLRCHLPTHLPNKEHVCKYCNKAFHIKQHLFNHELTHTHDFPLICDDCGQGFANKYQLTIHIRRHHTAHRPFVCGECDKKYVSITALKRHIIDSHTDYVVICDLCGVTLKSKALLSSHVSKKHRSETDMSKESSLNKKRKINPIALPMNSSTCNICGLVIESLLQLDEHMQEHTQQRLCPYCPKSFATQNALNIHLKMHSSEDRKFECKICGKSYLRAAHLNGHILKKHNPSEKTFKCDRCPLTFAIASELKNHTNRHDKIRPYICKTCGKKCITSSHLRVHNRIHTGERPFSCGVCYKSYTTKNPLVIHMRTHSKLNLDIPLDVGENQEKMSGNVENINDEVITEIFEVVGENEETFEECQNDIEDSQLVTI